MNGILYFRLVRRNGSVVDRDTYEGDLERNWEKTGENSAQKSG